MRLTQRHSATKPPEIDAVLVPPSASNTSQSIVIVFSPMAYKSIACLSDLPISLLISATLWLSLYSVPLFLEDVLPGSMAYSAVSQPLPLPCKKGGEPFSNEAVHITLVLPKDIRQLPYAFDAILFIIFTCLKL